jgi:signal transduction histidine kinase
MATRASLRTLLLASLVLPALVAFATVGGVGYALARHLLEHQLGEELSAVAGACASQVSGELLLTIAPGDDRVPTRTFKHLQRQLADTKEAAAVRRVFAVDRDGGVRADTDGLPVGTHLDALAADRPELEVALAGRPVASEVLFRGEDGRLYLRGYAPVRGASGAVVGLVGVEGSASFFAPLRALVRSSLVAAGLALLALALAALWLARLLTRPIERLVRSALRIGRGDLSTAVDGAPTHELGILSRELEAMRRALADRDRQLKMMLAGVAHEVRNPLGGLELFAGLLSEELGSPSPSLDEARAHVARMRGDLGYLQRIVEDFLAFAREQPLAEADLDAGALAHSAAELVRGDAQARGVTIALETEAARLMGDEDLLRAALVNLVKNAVQASPAGAQVRVRARVQGEAARLEVEDRGPGVPAEAAERIFEPFFTTREKGTGLGLPLARKIVRAHRGELGFSSRPGETIFWIELPLASAGTRAA